MTPVEREKMKDLCKRIQTEKHSEIFDHLVQELNDLLEIKHEPHRPRAHDQAELSRAMR